MADAPAEAAPRTAARSFPTVTAVAGQPLDQADADPVVALPRAAAVSAQRAKWLSDRLAEQVEQEGVAGLVSREIALDQSSGMPYETGRESVRALAVLEQRERDRAERAARDMLRLRLQAAALERQQETVTLVVGALRRFAELYGIDWSAPTTRRAAQCAILEAKAEAGRPRP